MCMWHYILGNVR